MSISDVVDSVLAALVVGSSLLTLSVFCFITLVAVPLAVALGRWVRRAVWAPAAVSGLAASAGPHEAIPGARQPIAGARRAAAGARPRPRAASSGPGGRGQIGRTRYGTSLPPRIIDSLSARAAAATTTRDPHGSRSERALPWAGL